MKSYSKSHNDVILGALRYMKAKERFKKLVEKTYPVGAPVRVDVLNRQLERFCFVGAVATYCEPCDFGLVVEVSTETAVELARLGRISLCGRGTWFDFSYAQLDRVESPR